MPDSLFESIGWIGLVTLAAVIIGTFSRGRRIDWRWLLAAVMTMVVYELLLTRCWGAVPDPLGGTDWNWTGKLLALGLSLAIASLPVVGWRRVGLTLHQDRAHLRGPLILSITLAILFLALALWLPGEGVDGETLAFQLTMPGLDEELFYRGVLLLMFNEAFGRPLRVLGTQMGWGALLTSLAFGLVHALGYDDGAYTFSAMAMATTGISALLLVWVREKTGSLLLPILLHNFGNAIFLLV